MGKIKFILNYLKDKGALCMLRTSGFTAAEIDILTARYVFNWSRRETCFIFKIKGRQLRKVERKAARILG